MNQIYRPQDFAKVTALSSFDTRLRPASSDRHGGLTIRTGIVCNPRSHHNRRSVAPGRPFAAASVIAATPRTKDELGEVLAEFARQGVELLVIDGGDGTVRDVLTHANMIWSTSWPQIAILPTGKTNALALDLGIPAGWTLEEALTAARDQRVALRRPIEIARPGGMMPLRGFLFGGGAFVDATALAHRTHRAGAFNGVAVGLALGWSVLQTIFGSAASSWRAGTRMRIRLDEGKDGTVLSGNRYLFLASTLKRLPVGLKPFGRPRAGLKTLIIDAPPRRMLTLVPALLTGSESPRLAEAGYRRADAESIDLFLDADFILDGEHYPGGALTLRQGAPLSFVVP